MKPEYDFTKSRPNPYARKLKRQISLRIDEDAIAYFKAMSVDSDIPYQNLINLFLRDCARTGKRLDLSWRVQATRH